MVLQCHVQLAACPTKAAPVARWKKFTEYWPARGLHHTTERKLLASSVQAACPDCMTARFISLYAPLYLYDATVSILHSMPRHKTALQDFSCLLDLYCTS